MLPIILRHFSMPFSIRIGLCIPVVALVCMLLPSISKDLYLDAGLSSKHDVAKTEDLTWLNQFGTIGTFLKNDIKLIKRNKRSKTTVGLSVIFSWFLFFTNSIEVYNNPTMHMPESLFPWILNHFRTICTKLG
jgi:hypothetical protein